MLKAKYLLYIGGSIPIVFWITTVICAIMLGDYNHFSRMVSELGAIGTKSRFVFSAGLILCSLMSVLFVFNYFPSSH